MEDSPAFDPADTTVDLTQQGTQATQRDPGLLGESSSSQLRDMRQGMQAPQREFCLARSGITYPIPSKCLCVAPELRQVPA